VIDAPRAGLKKSPPRKRAALSRCRVEQVSNFSPVPVEHAYNLAVWWQTVWSKQLRSRNIARAISSLNISQYNQIYTKGDAHLLPWIRRERDLSVTA
jgi:hypothetical protein